MAYYKGAAFLLFLVQSSFALPAWVVHLHTYEPNGPNRVAEKVEMPSMAQAMDQREEMHNTEAAMVSNGMRSTGMSSNGMRSTGMSSTGATYMSSSNGNNIMMEMPHSHSQAVVDAKPSEPVHMMEQEEKKMQSQMMVVPANGNGMTAPDGDMMASMMKGEEAMASMNGRGRHPYGYWLLYIPYRNGQGQAQNGNGNGMMVDSAVQEMNGQKMEGDGQKMEQDAQVASEMNGMVMGGAAHEGSYYPMPEPAKKAGDKCDINGEMVRESECAFLWCVDYEYMRMVCSAGTGVPENYSYDSGDSPCSLYTDRCPR